jgi:hypothetical protein
MERRTRDRRELSDLDIFCLVVGRDYLKQAGIGDGRGGIDLDRARAAWAVPGVRERVADYHRAWCKPGRRSTPWAAEQFEGAADE